MKTKGRTAWLITWEGPESEYYGRCKVVTVLRPQFTANGIESLLPILFSSEYNYTLCEKMGCIASSGKDPFFMKDCRHVNPELLYGHIGKHYLRARKVKNLRCEESKRDCLESTLYWTELAKYKLNPGIDFDARTPDVSEKWVQQDVAEREAQYSYSIRASIEEKEARKSKQGCQS